MCWWRPLGVVWFRAPRRRQLASRRAAAVLIQRCQSCRRHRKEEKKEKRIIWTHVRAHQWFLGEDWWWLGGVLVLQLHQGEAEATVDPRLPDSVNSSHFADAESCRGGGGGGWGGCQSHPPLFLAPSVTSACLPAPALHQLHPITRLPHTHVPPFFSPFLFFFTPPSVIPH